LLGGCGLPDVVSLFSQPKPAGTFEDSELGSRAILQDLVRKANHPGTHLDSLRDHPAARLSDKYAETQAKWNALNHGRKVDRLSDAFKRRTPNVSTMTIEPREISSR
jgi:hypothetical protein